MISRTVLVAGLSFAFLPVVGVGPAFACSCVQATEADQFKRAGVVFKGTVTAREMPGGEHHDGSAGTIYTFEVSKLYKGRIVQPQRVHTARDSATCGVNLSGAGPFLVFASGTRGAPATPTAASPPLEMNLCGGTHAIAADAEPAFGPGKPVAPGKPAEPAPDPAPPPAEPDPAPEPTGDEPGGAGSPGGIGVLPPLLGGLTGVLPLGGVSA